MSSIRVIQTLQSDDIGLSDNTILAIMADYIDKRCDLEDFENYMLDRANPTPHDGDCQECGNPFVLNDDGTTNHLIPESHGRDEIDHDMDADHVAVPEDD